MICRTYLPSVVSNLTCRIKYIDRNHLKGYLSLDLRKPARSAWVHAVMFYKYFTYQRIATEYRDDLCAWINGDSKSFLLEYFRPLIKQYTNANHSCPYTGKIFAKADNISVQQFAFPQIVPAGRYRIDINVTINHQKIPMVGGSLYGSVSDHRIEVV